MGNTIKQWMKPDHLAFLGCGLFLLAGMSKSFPKYFYELTATDAYLTISFLLWLFAFLYDIFEKGERGDKK